MPINIPGGGGYGNGRGGGNLSGFETLIALLGDEDRDLLDLLGGEGAPQVGVSSRPRGVRFEGLPGVGAGVVGPMLGGGFDLGDVEPGFVETPGFPGVPTPTVEVPPPEQPGPQAPIVGAETAGVEPAPADEEVSAGADMVAGEPVREGSAVEPSPPAGPSPAPEPPVVEPPGEEDVNIEPLPETEPVEEWAPYAQPEAGVHEPVSLPTGEGDEAFPETLDSTAVPGMPPDFDVPDETWTPSVEPTTPPGGPIEGIEQTYPGVLPGEDPSESLEPLPFEQPEWAQPDPYAGFGSDADLTLPGEDMEVPELTPEQAGELETVASETAPYGGAGANVLPGWSPESSIVSDMLEAPEVSAPEMAAAPTSAEPTISQIIAEMAAAPSVDTVGDRSAIREAIEREIAREIADWGGDVRGELFGGDRNYREG